MNLIVAVDSNWAIGKENKLLVSIPQDMKFFPRDNEWKKLLRWAERHWKAFREDSR